MTVSMNDVKILVVVNERSEYIEKGLEKLPKQLKGILYLAYIKNIDFYPAEVLLEFEKTFENIRKRGLNILNKIANKARKLGFKTEIVGVYCGINKVLELEKRIKPNIILVDCKCGLFRRLLLDDYFDSLLCRTKTPILVAR